MKLALGLAYLSYGFRFRSLRGINIFFCDTVELYPPLAPHVYRTLYEVVLLSRHLHALVVKKEDYEHYISSPEAVVKKPFVDLTTVVLTNYLPNGMKFPLVVLIQ